MQKGLLTNHQIPIWMLLTLSIILGNGATWAKSPSIQGLQLGQLFPLEARMGMCEEAIELRTRYNSGELRKLRVQCKSENEIYTVYVAGDDRIYSITLRKNYDTNLSQALIDQLREKQVEKYGPPDMEQHKLPDGFTGEVWQYGWGSSCFLDTEYGRITAGAGPGSCLVVDTDMTASRKLLVEYFELIDADADPGSISSDQVFLELYSKEKGARALDFSDTKKSADNSSSTSQETTPSPESVTSSEPALNTTTSEASSSFADCKDLYQQIKSEAPGDIANCEKPWPTVDVNQCEAPTMLETNRPTSHIVLALDASGSMAAKIGGQTKMHIAKKEISSFINDLNDDVPVGMVVYGHRGDNTKKGKSESCGSIEWALPVGSAQGKLKSVIKTIQPTGWTPLADTLKYLETELSTLTVVKKDDISSPVVYLVSDGKETCGGDPVAAARSLKDSGMHVSINVIGFDVDDETRAELEAISEAGGGKYYPAKDSGALRKQLNAAKENENAVARYNYCIRQNIGKAEVAFHNMQIEAVGCMTRETETKWRDVITSRIDSFETDEEKACEAKVRSMLYTDFVKTQLWLSKNLNMNLKMRKEAAQNAYQDSVFGL